MFVCAASYESGVAPTIRVFYDGMAAFEWVMRNAARRPTSVTKYRDGLVVGTADFHKNWDEIEIWHSKS